MKPVHDMGVAELAAALKSRALSSREATQALLDRIQTHDKALGAFLHVDAEGALARAAAADAALAAGTAGPLAGVPVAHKDIYVTADMPTTAGSKMLAGYRSPFDATVVARLNAAGTVSLGKLNCDEFAMGSANENSAYFPASNPWDPGRVPGGSSGGSAVAVAARLVPGVTGTDTGGSIRQPAAFCGTVGIKPTYGRVSRYGLVAYGSSLDQIGPLTRTAADAAAMLTVIAGHDAKDSTSAPREVPDFEKAIAGAADLSGLTIGLPDEYWGEGVDAEVREACRQAMDTATSLGAKVVSVSLPHTPYAVATYYIVAMAEASSNLARFDGVRYGRRAPQAKTLEELYELSRSEGFGAEVRRRIVIGTYVLSAGYYDAYYRKAAQVRRLIRQDFLDAYSKCDVVCGPTSPFAAFPIGKMSGDPLQMYLSDIFTISLNLAGLPGLSMPVGLGKDSGLPIGMQLFGPAFDETAILRTAKVLGDALPKLPQPTGLA